jgi:hypothetical protein
MLGSIVMNAKWKILCSGADLASCFWVDNFVEECSDDDSAWDQN